MAYIGKIKERVTLTLTLTGDYKFGSYYSSDPFHIYTMHDENENVFVWKTSAMMKINSHQVERGDTIRLKGTVKEHSEYRGTEQTILTRIKVLEVLKKGLTKEERIKLKRKKQLESIQENDFLYRMSYRRYKQHYSDCETLAGSYDGDGTIEVIVREGRLKPSGTRFKSFHNFYFGNNDEEFEYNIYAINEENAWKQLKKELKKEGKSVDNWVLLKVI